MFHVPLLLFLLARERGFYCFPGFCISRSKHSITWKEIFTFRASGLFKLAVLKYVLKCCLKNKIHFGVTANNKCIIINQLYYHRLMTLEVRAGSSYMIIVRDVQVTIK